MLFVLATLVLSAGPGPVPGVQVADEGVNQGQVTRLNCVGAGVNCTRSGATGTLTITGASVSAYDTIQDEGTPLTQRTTLDFVGTAVTCTDTGAKTQCSITGGGGSGLTYPEVAAASLAGF